jgi:beta-glucanase (GH16 family)
VGTRVAQQERDAQHTSTHTERPKRSRVRRFAVPTTGGVLLVLILTLVVAAAGPSQTPAPARTTDHVELTSAAPLCGVLGSVARLLGGCGPTNPSNATDSPTAATTCSDVAKLLGLCQPPPSATAAAGPNGSGQPTSAAPTTTSTSGPSAPPSSDGSANAAPDQQCSGTTPPIDAPSGKWTCTFDDEFNGTSLDTTKWQPQLTADSGYTTGAVPSQPCYVDSPKTISESGGYLNLSIVRTLPFLCKRLDGLTFPTSFVGGMVSSYKLFSQQYGYFQTRAEMPASTANGLMETLWLYPENETLYGPWPNSGEIDYAEFYSDVLNADVPVFHYPGSTNDPTANSGTTGGCTMTGAATSGQFNTYALSWTPTTMTAYFNGVPCITDVYAPYVASPDTAPEPFNQPFFLAFTAALGMGSDSPGAAIPSTSTMEIDWTRVWQYG